MNRLFHHRRLMPLPTVNGADERDTLYSVGVVDTEGGATVRVPPMPNHRYASVYRADNDHYVPEVTSDAGEHQGGVRGEQAAGEPVVQLACGLVVVLLEWAPSRL